MFEQIGEKISRTFVSIFGSYNERMLRRLQPIVDQINTLKPTIEKLSDAELRTKTDEFKKRLAEGASLDDILPEAFACVRETAWRVLGHRRFRFWIYPEKDKTSGHSRQEHIVSYQEATSYEKSLLAQNKHFDKDRYMAHFDVQLIGGIVLHQGKIAEMATGEGKTMVATLAAYLNALTGKGVHIVTVNDYLARRDRDWMGPIYEFLGLTVGVIQNQTGNEERKAAYACDIVYGTNNEFGFDYLRDNMKIRLEHRAQRVHHYAIVDEVDNILVDEARTPLIISGPAEESTEKYYLAERAATRLSKGRDYEVKEKEHSVVLTEAGIEKAQQLVGVDDFYTGKNMEWPHHIEQALRAKELYHHDKEYIVKDGAVIIVDEFTGRLMPGRRWSDGLHQAVEAKEHLKIREENQTLATITLQNYFKLYDKLAGMTGTAATEAMEFDKIYKLEVMVIPPNRTLIRHTAPDMVFRTEPEKFNAIIEEIVRVNETGRPILVGTTSIENSERLSEMLKRRGVKHEVLNAKHHEREAQIIAQAGQKGNVTLATNMAGRGTDIVLGPGVTEIGGLHILGTERHEARRIDNQLRGRSGRQGDPGSSQFIVSMEDTLLRLFAPDWIRGVLYKLGMKEGVPIESRMISRALQNAQKKMESHNFDIRKNLLDYDQVMNEQRQLIYSQRQQILEGRELKTMMLEMIKDRVLKAIDLYLPESVKEQDWDYQGLKDRAKRKFGLDIPLEQIKAKSVQETEDTLISKVNTQYNEREQKLTADYMRQLEQYILLDRIDEKWKEHLYEMDHLRSGIGLRGYAQVDPKIEYKREGYAMFNRMIDTIKEEVSDLIFKVRFDGSATEKSGKHWKATEFSHREIGSFEGIKREAQAAQATEKPRPVVVGDKVGRNEPCPCGSGKKYKKCCGART